MPDPITWYALGRTIIDTETILEAIDAQLLTHNLDPSAHGQENESVYEHRVAPLLDHLQYTIYNIKLNPAARIYKAIVSTGLEGDFTTIQAAIDWANLYGGGTIFIKAGTYTVSQDITLYSNITLLGEDDDTTFLDFNSGTAVVKALGSFGSKLKNINISNLQFKNCLNLSYGAIRFLYVQDSKITDCYFTGNWSAGDAYGADIYLTGNSCSRITIERNRSISSGWFIWGGGSFITVEKNFSDDSYAGFIYGSYVGLSRAFIHENIIDTPTDTAIYIDSNGAETTIKDNRILHPAGIGIRIDAPQVLIEGNFIDGYSAGGKGISLDSDVLHVRIVDNYLYRLNSDGVYLTSGNDGCTIIGNQFFSITGYGVVIASATCDKNIILGNVFRGCSLGAYSDSGTATEFGHNVTI